MGLLLIRSQDIQELCLVNSQCYWKMISAVVGIHYYNFTIICLHLHQISNEESSHEEKIIMNDDALVCNICLALTTNLIC